ncbi:Uncharacterised protein [Yersinia pseudotuberculosis]|nr:Uncharacterised protein [Yersinia pseudotuberculosis]
MNIRPRLSGVRLLLLSALVVGRVFNGVWFLLVKFIAT